MQKQQLRTHYLNNCSKGIFHSIFHRQAQSFVKSDRFEIDIIIKQRNSEHQSILMENYQLLQFNPHNYITPFSAYFYYPPIMIIHHADHSLQSEILHHHIALQPNLFHNPPTPQGNIFINNSHDQNKDKNETQDFQQKENNPLNINKEKQGQEIYVKVTNRNLLPNNLNLLLSYIRRINKSGKIVSKIIDRLRGDQVYTTKKFYAYQSYVKDKTPSHKSKETLREITEHIDSNFSIFTLEEQLFYNKVCRILINLFLKGEYANGLLTSSKIHKTSKNEHLKIRRYLQLKLQKAPKEIMHSYRFIEG